MSVFEIEVKKIIEKEVELVINHFTEEINQLRSNRPSPALVENILVDYYQSKAPLKQIATINIIMPSTIVVEPWDKLILPSIIQAISASDLNLTPIADAEKVRLTLPPLSKERREQLVKLLHEYSEKARVRLRQSRERANKKVESLFKDKEISEDEKFKYKDEVQKLVGEFNEKIKKMVENKEKEISS